MMFAQYVNWKKTVTEKSNRNTSSRV